MGLIFVLFFIGFALLAVEILAAPGAVIGIIGLAFCGAAVFVAFNNFGPSVGWTVLVAFLLLVICGIWLAFKLNVFKRMSVNEQVDGRVNEIDEALFHKGSTGVAMGNIRPGGKAKFGDLVVEVFSYGEMINSGTEIEIINIENNKIYVKPKP